MAEPFPFNPRWLHAEGVRVLREQEGVLYDNVGLVKFAPRSIGWGIDRHLWNVLRCACDELKLAIYVSVVDRGRFSPNSRHGQGRAVDISRIDRPGTPFKDWQRLTHREPLGLKLAQWFLDHGWKVGERGRSGSQPGILLGPVGHPLNPSKVSHSDHLHASILQKLPR